MDDSKLDYEGFFSPLVLERRAEYMHKNRVQADGALRPSDNWQKGIPFTAYMKSLWRHFFAVWRGHRSGADIEEELCAVMFNAEGYLHELLKAKRPAVLAQDFDNIVEHLRARNAWAGTCGAPGYYDDHLRRDGDDG